MEKLIKIARKFLLWSNWQERERCKVLGLLVDQEIYYTRQWAFCFQFSVYGKRAEKRG